MPLFRRKRALAASAQRVSTSQLSAAGGGALNGTWQERAWSYYNELGEVWFCGQFYARGLSMLRLYVAQLDEKGEPKELEDERYRGVLERVADRQGGRKQMLAAYGRLMFVNGECYLLGWIDADGVERWEVVSKFELRPVKNGYERYAHGPGKKVFLRDPQADPVGDPGDDQAMQPDPPDELPGNKPLTGVAYRLWKRHPQYSGLADGPMRGVLPICEKLALIDLADRAEARSRANQAGMMYMPEEISMAPPEPAPDEDPQADPLLDDLTEALTSPIRDEGAASSIVPFILRGPAVIADKAAKDLIGIFKFGPDAAEKGQRSEEADKAIKRLALGLDLPAEILLGLADSNHWSAWKIDEEVWKGHLQPIAEVLCEDLTSSFLRPALADEGLPTDRIVVWYDEAEVVTNPDQSANTRDAWDRIAVSDEYYRGAIGAPETAKPSEEEWLRRAGLKINNAQLVSGEPLADPNAPADGGDGTEEPTTTQDQQPPDEEKSAQDKAAKARIEAACMMLLERCRELAGARLRSRLNGRKDEYAHVDNRLLPHALGAETVRSLVGPNVQTLVAGAHGAFEACMREWGIERSNIDALRLVIEQHAASTLCDIAPGLPTVK